MAANTTTGLNCTIILINYNGFSDTVECVNSIIDTQTNAKIIILDNNSLHQEGLQLKKLYKQNNNITCLLSSQNLGFAGGNNYGCQYVKTPYVIFLNNDTIVTNQWLEELLQPFQNYPDIAFIQPKIRSYFNREYFEYAGASGGMLDKLGYPYARGRIGFTLEQDLGQYDDPIEVIWASGTCLASRTQIFRDLGGFEERFFFYHEETDLCLRAINAGYRNLCQPSAVIYHKGAQSSRNIKFKKIMLVHRNNLFLITRNFPLRKQLKILPIRLMLDYLSCVFYFTKSQFLYIPAVFYAHLSFLKHLPWLLLTNTHQPHAYQKLKPFSIMWNSFILKKERYSEIFPIKKIKIATIQYAAMLPENHIHRAQSKFLKILCRPLVLLPLIAITLIVSWFRSRQLIAAGEEALVFYSPWRLLNLYNSPWYDAGTGFAMPVIIPRITLLFCAAVLAVVFPNWLVQALIFLTLLLCGLFGMYHFVRSVTSKNDVALVAAIFYLLNTYVMSQVWGRLLYTSMTFWAALPCWLFLWGQWLRTSQLKYLLLFLLTLQLLSFAFGHPSSILVLFLGIFFHTIFTLLQTPHRRIAYNLFIISLTSLLASFWWLIPYLQIGQSSFSGLASWKQSLDSLSGVSNYFSVWDILRLNQQYLMSIHTYKGWFQSNQAILLTGTLPFILLIGYLSHIRRSWSNYLFLLFCITLFFSKGTNSPFGVEFYQFLFSYSPATQVLRNSYEKFGLLYLIPYSVFFALGMLKIRSLFPSSLLQRFAVGALTLSLFGLLPWPIWWGSLFGAHTINTRVTVPQAYTELNNYINESPIPGRILLLPFNSGDGVYLLWPHGHYTGWDPSEMLFDRATIAKVLREPYFDTKYKQLRYSFGTSLFSEILSEMQISYIIIRKDITNLGSRSVPDVRRILDSYSSLRLSFENDQGLIYVNQDPLAHALFIDQGGAIIPYRKISTTRFELVPDFTTVSQVTMKSTYHPNWQLKLRGHTISSDPIYGYANSWILPSTQTSFSNNDTIRIEFSI